MDYIGPVSNWDPLYAMLFIWSWLGGLVIIMTVIWVCNTRWFLRRHGLDERFCSTRPNEPSDADVRETQTRH